MLLLKYTGQAPRFQLLRANKILADPVPKKSCGRTNKVKKNKCLGLVFIAI
jgi:hypothetical protein